MKIQNNSAELSNAVKTRVVYLDIGKIEIKEMTLPELRPNQVLVEAHQASVCGSERHFYKGISVRPQDEARGRRDERERIRRTGRAEHAYPMGPLGHEGGGTIIEKGSAVEEYLGGGRVSVGDRVASLKYPTYTDYWVTDISKVQSIPEGVSFEVGCLYEPLGCAAWAAINSGVRIGDTVAVNGVGFAGNILLQGALRSGASMVITIDVDDRKLEVARRLGVHHTVNPRREDPVERIDELTDDEGVDVAIEAVGGSGAGIVQALGQVRHNGLLALYGDNYAPISEFCFHRFHEDGLEVRNLSPVHYTDLRAVENMREAYRAVQRGVFDLDIILENSDRHRLDELPEVFAREASPEGLFSLKTIIRP